MTGRSIYVWFVCTAIVFVIGSLGASSARAGAFDWATGPSIYDKPGEKDWSVSVLPYMWFAGVTGRITTPTGVNQTGSATFQTLGGDLVVGVEGVVDLRWRRWHAFSDGSWVKFSSSELLIPSTPGPAAPSFYMNLASSSAFGTAGVAYELPLKWKTAVDLYLASRWWRYTSSVSIATGPFWFGSPESKAVWADVVGGFRLNHKITDHWGVGFGADVGGGGSDVTWQTYGTLKYMINRHAGLLIGYRALSVEYTNSSGFQIDMTQRGLLMGFEMAI